MYFKSDENDEKFYNKPLSANVQDLKKVGIDNR